MYVFLIYYRSQNFTKYLDNNAQILYMTVYNQRIFDVQARRYFKVSYRCYKESL